MSKRGNKALSLILSATLIFSGILYVPAKVEAEEEGSDYGLSNPHIEYDYRDTVTFGHYWQEDTNGDEIADENDEKQPIVWQILKKYEDGTALVVSDKILDVGQYFSGTTTALGQKSYDCTWETSTLRAWLNDEFYKTAFSSEDKEAIVYTDVPSSDNPRYGTKGGNDTKDNVFVLSYEEVSDHNKELKYNFNYFDQSRQAKATSYAKNRGLNKISAPKDYGTWWLRTPGSSTSACSLVYGDGCLRLWNCGTFESGVGIRPALRIKLNNPNIINSGKVIVSVNRSEWDTVVFGKYNEKDIVWRVLNISEDDAFLVSDRILLKDTDSDWDEEFYDYNSWKDSRIRLWLNNDIYNNSFSEVEREMIKTTNVKTEALPDLNIEEDEDTMDQIFLLSVNDLIDPQYGFVDHYEVHSDARIALDLDGNSNGLVWYLRSRQYNENTGYRITHVGVKGDVMGNSGNPGAYYGIRPALHINLKSSAWKKGEKIVVYEHSGDISNPTAKPTTEPTSTPMPSATPTQKPTTDPAQNPSAIPTAQVTPTTAPSEAVTPTVAPSPAVKKDKVTTFSIKNKAKVKASAKIKIKDKDKIKKITLNGKTIKIKKNKTSYTLKLKSYKKKLKKKGKWNTLKVTDYKGNVKTIKFKIK